MFCVASASPSRGEVVVVMGPSGSGSQPSFAPSTLWRNTQGRIEIDGIELSTCATLTRFAKEVGMVFQQFNLFLT